MAPISLRLSSRFVMFACLIPMIGVISDPAHAASGVNLRWSRCFGDAGTTDRTFACNSNEGSQVLVASFQLGGDLLQTSGIEVEIDLAVGLGPVLPAWWQLENPLGCRTGALTVNAAIPGTAVNCVEWDSGGGSGGLEAYTIGYRGPNTARIGIGFASSTPLPDLVAAREYFACNVEIDNTKTVGPGSCAGCSAAGCIVLTQVTCMTPPIRTNLTGPTNGTDSNFATWQGGADVLAGYGYGCPGATPTHATTWSRVKTLYR